MPDLKPHYRCCKTGGRKGSRLRVVCWHRRGKCRIKPGVVFAGLREDTGTHHAQDHHNTFRLWVRYRPWRNGRYGSATAGVPQPFSSWHISFAPQRGCLLLGRGGYRFLRPHVPRSEHVGPKSLRTTGQGDWSGAGLQVTFANSLISGFITRAGARRLRSRGGGMGTRHL